MRVRPRSGARFRPGLPLILFAVLLSLLWIAGGASRPDVAGQVVVRGGCWVMLVITLIWGERAPLGRARPVLLILLAALALALSQLIPLPPSIWQALPGRAMLVEAARAAGEAQPWRSWSIVPSATMNAASSLIVPFVTLLCLTGLTDAERQWLPGLVLGTIVAAMLVGLLQVSGGGLNNPFVNDTPGEVSGTFANRNHFALFLAIGCLLAPVWAFLDGREPRWRGPVALGLVLLFVLTILATGSRAGLLLGGLGLGIGVVMVGQGIRRVLGRYPRWVYPASIAGVVGVIVVLVLISVAAGRAASIDRIFAIDPGQDMRSRGLPTILAMNRDYFPVGAGLGGFDPIFQMSEPFALLKPTYFNHVHNDWLEIVLDAGAPGLLLLSASVLWWGWASICAWRTGSGTRHAVPKLGSAILLLVLVASIFDYPARTPTIMAMIVIAAVWLSRSDVHELAASALPKEYRHL